MQGSLQLQLVRLALGFDSFYSARVVLWELNAVISVAVIAETLLQSVARGHPEHNLFYYQKILFIGSEHPKKNHLILIKNTGCNPVLFPSGASRDRRSFEVRGSVGGGCNCLSTTKATEPTSTNEAAGSRGKGLEH